MPVLVFPSPFGNEYSKRELKPGFLTSTPFDFSPFPSPAEDLITWTSEMASFGVSWVQSFSPPNHPASHPQADHSP